MMLFSCLCDIYSVFLLAFLIIVFFQTVGLDIVGRMEWISRNRTRRKSFVGFIEMEKENFGRLVFRLGQFLTTLYLSTFEYK